MLCCMPSIPLGGEFCINKDVLIFASAGPLIWFFLNNNKLECDTLTHRKKKNGKNALRSHGPPHAVTKKTKLEKSVKRLNVMSTLPSLYDEEGELCINKDVLILLLQDL